jgi:hypothetical protein
MRRAASVGFALTCAWACLAEEYSIVKSFEDGDGDGNGPGGAPAMGGNGGTAATGDGGEEPGSGGSSTGGLGGVTTGGAPTGGTPSGGRTPIGGGPTSGGAAGRGGAPGGRGGAPGGRGGFGGDGLVGGGGFGKGGIGGASGGKGGTAGAGAGGTAGTSGCGGACIVHRYAFSGTDTTATDSVGSAHGTIVGGIQSSGVVTLAGGATDQYVSFPASILTGLADVTLEFWVTWTGGTVNWQRVFDFGSNDGAPGDQGSTNTDSSYFFFTPRALATSASAGCTTTASGIAGAASETCLIGSAAFPTSMTQVAVTTQGTTLSLYIGGASAGTPVTLPGGIASVTRTNNWLGRSQYSSDTEFSGSISEFRVYGVARSASQISASYSAGPDTPPTQ